MKKLVLGLSLIATLACLVSPAMAETKQPQAARTLSAADQAFLASLTRMPLAQVNAAAKPEPPPIGENALCQVSASCGNGYSVSCQGNNSTTSCSGWDRNCAIGEQGHVTCDGVTTWCPDVCEPEPCGPDWCQGESDCAWNCYPCPYTYTCNATYCTDRCRCNFQICAP